MNYFNDGFYDNETNTFHLCIGLSKICIRQTIYLNGACGTQIKENLIDNWLPSGSKEDLYITMPPAGKRCSTESQSTFSGHKRL